jgi:hypothetical protein
MWRHRRAGQENLDCCDSDRRDTYRDALLLADGTSVDPQTYRTIKLMAVGGSKIR